MLYRERTCIELQWFDKEKNCNENYKYYSARKNKFWKESHKYSENIEIGKTSNIDDITGEILK